MDAIIWQPSFVSGYDFMMSLDRDFAKDMIDSQVSVGRQGKMNQLANLKLNELGNNWKDPYTFLGNSRLLSQLYIGEGVRLTTDSYSILDLVNNESTKPLKYISYNVGTSKEAFILLALFDKWVKYANKK